MAAALTEAFLPVSCLTPCLPLTLVHTTNGEE